MHCASISIVSSTLEVSPTPPHTSTDSTDTGTCLQLFVFDVIISIFSIVSSTLEVSSTPPHTSSDSTDTGMWSLLIDFISLYRMHSLTHALCTKHTS